MKKKHMISKKAIVLLLSLSLLVTAALSTTLAYLVSNPVSVVNSFTPARVDSSVVETISGATKNDVKIQNDGDIPAYIRAKVVFTWQDTAGNVYGKKPETTLGCPHNNCDCDYTITYNLDYQPENDDSGSTAGKWTLEENDGFYYYNQPVDAGETTKVLFTGCSPIAGKAPEGYSFCVEILCDAIQADGMDADSAVDAWTIAKGDQD